MWLPICPTPFLHSSTPGARSRRWRPTCQEPWSVLLNRHKLLLLRSMLLLMLWSSVKSLLMRCWSPRCSESGSSLEAMISWWMPSWCLMLLCTRWHLPYCSRWSQALNPTDKILLWYEGILNDIMQGLRHQNPNLCMNVDIKAKQEPVDLKFLGIQVQSILKKLHKIGLVLRHCTSTLSQGVELIEMTLNKFLQ
jgi:hypothetical protein